MLVAFPLVFLLSLPVAKNQEQLLVVVEASPKEVVDSAALREAIAAELGMHVLSPVDEEPAEGVAMMTVAMAPDQAVVAYRRGESTIRRAIDLPPDGRQRLRLVTWLAGNVVRDQTAELLRGRPGDTPEENLQAHPPEQTPEDVTGLCAGVAPLPSPTPPTPLTPVVLPAPVAEPTQPDSATTVALQPAPARRHLWTVAALVGRGFFDPDRITCNCGQYWVNDEGGQYEIEVMRGSPSFAIGGTYISARGSAGGLTLGWYRQPHPWFTTEVGATVGLWSFIKDIGFNATTDLFFRLGAGLAFRLTSWLDVTTRLSVFHAMSEDKYLGYASIGLRYRLPL